MSMHCFRQPIDITFLGSAVSIKKMCNFKTTYRRPADNFTQIL